MIMRTINNVDNEFVGKKIEDVRKIPGLTYRVMNEDGKVYAGTMDLKPFRYNFSVENGIIVSVKMG
jgi:hypothetical protein